MILNITYCEEINEKNMRSGFPQPCTGASYWMVPHLCEQGNQKQQRKLQEQQNRPQRFK